MKVCSNWKPAPASGPSTSDDHVTVQQGNASSMSVTVADIVSGTFTETSPPPFKEMDGGTLPRTERTEASAFTWRFTRESALACALSMRADSTASALCPVSAAHMSAATPAANGDEKLVPHMA